MPICPHCGNSHPANARFCPKTGQSLDIADQNASPVAAVAQDQSPAVTPIAARLPAVEKPGKGIQPLYFLIGGGFLIIVVGMAVILFSLVNNSPTKIASRKDSPASPEIVVNASQPEDKETQTSSPLSNTLVSTSTVTPLPVATFTLTVTPSPEPTQPTFLTEMNTKDQAVLVFVPSGKFIMGSNPEADPYFWGAESPQHEVTLSEYWIYQTEVTNAMYQQCAAEKACPIPSQKKSRSVEDYYGNAQYGNFPVIYVNWVSAQAYCKWAGGRLPTEAEWEKAARGDQDTRLFPWGSTPALVSQANFCDKGCAQTHAERDKDDGYPDTAPVGSYPEGISPYGALDMAGNVWEWVFDWFQPTYSSAPVTNPVGPASSKYRTIRGGAWSNPSAGVRLVQRDGVRPDLSLDTLGFRCVVEVQP